MKIENLIRKNILDLSAYSSARDKFEFRQDYIYLDANENSYGSGLNRYPNNKHALLKKKLSGLRNIPIENIILGNGTDEIIDLAFRVFCTPSYDNIITIEPSYGMYKVLSDINDIEVRQSFLDRDFQINIEEVLSKIDTNTKIIFITNPNNPTGNHFDLSVITEIVEKSSCMVFLDEAYIDFNVKNSLIGKINYFDNLIISQTFSKGVGLAGIRLGVGYSSKKVIKYLKKVKPPYNVNSLTEEKALEILSNMDLINKNIKKINNSRSALIKDLKKIDFVQRIYPSDANFLLIKIDDANKRYQQLIDNNIVVRNRTNDFGCLNCLRITIGTEAENKKLIEVMKSL